MGALSTHLTFRYIEGYINDAPVAVGNKIPSFKTIDAQVAYDFSLDKAESRLSFGINNLADEDPPALTPLSATRERPGYDEYVHDVRGRLVYVNYNQTF